MRYNHIRKMDISNGEGIGIALFVQGCHFHCKGCFNQETWNFNGGKEWTESIKKQFLDLADKPYIKRVSILGGEPLCNENVQEVENLIYDVRKRYCDKSIWIYTGYSVKESMLDTLTGLCGIKDKYSVSRFNCIINADIVVDGRFDIKKQDLFNKEIIWAGSTNQHIIDVKKTLCVNWNNIIEKPRL